MYERVKFLSKLFKPAAPTNTIYPPPHNIQTRFYYDIEDHDHFVILTRRAMGYLIKNADIKRGYVARKWLAENFNNAIQMCRLTSRSCLVEFLTDARSSFGGKERLRLYVR